MRRMLELVKKDLATLLASWPALVLALVLPAVLVWVAGELRTGKAPLRVLFADAPAQNLEEREVASLRRLARVLREDARLQVEVASEPVRDPLGRLERDGYDLVLAHGGTSGDDLSAYTAETDPARLAQLDQLAAGILRTHVLLETRLDPELVRARRPTWPEVLWAEYPIFEELFLLGGVPLDPPDEYFLRESWLTPTSARARGRILSGIWWTEYPIFEELFMLGVVPVDPLVEYFPDAADRRLQHLPGVMTLVLCLLPFLLSLASSARQPPERGAPASAATLAGVAVPVAVALVSFSWMLILAQSFYDLHVKADLPLLVLLLLPALLAAGFLGRLAGLLSSSPLALATACSAYLLATFYLCGFLVPIEESGGAVRQLSHLLPATFVRPTIGAWSFGATLSLGELAHLLPWLQAGVYGALAVALEGSRWTRARTAT